MGTTQIHGGIIVASCSLHLRLGTIAVVCAVIGAALAVSSAHADRDLVCANAPENVFTDVEPGSTHAANIDCVAAYAITVGVGGGNYDPTGHVSRGQMASFLVNFVGMALDEAQEASSSLPAFQDIAGTTHATNISIAAELGITVGRTSTRYAPAEDVTRAQMATFVAQAIEAAGGELPSADPNAFTDIDGSVHAANIDRLASVEIVRGVGGGVYDPAGYVTRAQMATFLANAAGYLYDQGLWLAPALPTGGPQVVLVAQAQGELDTIEVHWDRPVDVSATGDRFAVTQNGNGENQDGVVATGTEVTHDGELSAVVLDASLEVGDVYWLQVEGGVAVDDEDRSNEPQSIAFVFATDTGADPDDDAAVAPAISSVITEPESDRLVVTFDQEVICPTTTAGAAAWSFSNSSVDDGSGHASGVPDSVEQDAAPSETCSLVYSTDGVGNGDFGTLSYTQPGDDAARVTSESGLPLPTTTDATVVDGVAPTFEGVAGHAGSGVLSLTFSEPIACSTIGTSQFSVTVDGAQVVVDSTGCTAPASSTPAITLASTVSAGQEVEVTIDEGTTLSGQSLDNQVVPSTRSVLVS